MIPTTGRPGIDRHAVRHPGHAGDDVVHDRTVVVVGGGIAGLAAATALAERGVHVTLLEAGPRLGGRVQSWPVDGQRTMSRGFHAFFRQYYNLRALLRRADPDLERLVAINDYPLQRPDGTRDSFTGLPTTPPINVLEFVRRSPAFSARALAKVDKIAALEMLQVHFPGTYDRYDGESAGAFLDRLRFPETARDLALEVFARSFFADPYQFAAGELVAMFHTYFVGSAEGLLFDVPDDDYDSTLWAPLGAHLTRLGVDVRTDAAVTDIEAGPDAIIAHTDHGDHAADAVTIATDPRVARRLCATIPGEDHEVVKWRERVGATRNAPPFVVVRLWLDRPVDADRPAFLGTAGYGPLDNVSLLERFELGAAQWAAEHTGSVVELHAYACAGDLMENPHRRDRLVDELLQELHRAYPETRPANILHREVLVQDDCTLVTPEPWSRRPGVETPWPTVTLAGDWVRTDLPVALMERAATTGFLAANHLLAQWGGRGHDLWTVPMHGLLTAQRLTPPMLRRAKP